MSKKTTPLGAFLVLVALATFFIGVSQNNRSMIGASIVSSISAAIVLIIGRQSRG